MAKEKEVNKGKKDRVSVDSSKYIWITEFTDSSMQSFYSSFNELEGDELMSFIPIVISSYGGELDVVTAMRDIIKSSEKPVATIAMGKAMSAGVALLAAGTPGLRFASPNTDVMIHEVASAEWGKTAEMVAGVDNLKRNNIRWLTNLANDMGLDYKTLRAEMDRRQNANWYLNPKEAKKWGVIDHIGLPRIVKVEQSYDLVGHEPFGLSKRKPKGK